MQKIYNIDCIQGAKQYLENESVDLIVTDPPFNLGFGGTTQTKTRKPRFAIIENDKLSFRDYQRFTISWLKEAYRVLKTKRHIYVCIDWRMYPYMFLWMRFVGFQIKNCIVWDKVNFGMGWQYRYRHELIIFAVKGNSKVRRVNKRNQADIWSIPRIPGSKTIHPTQKPIELFKTILQNSSEEGELAVDFFCGSGVAFNAAKQLNRKFVGFEIDKKYFDLINQNNSPL